MSERTVDGLTAARARGRTGGQKPKLGPRQVGLAQQMYDETDDKGKRAHTVAQIAAEFGVTRPTVYRHLGKASALSADPKPPEAGAPITAAGSPSTDRKPAPRRRPTKRQ